MRRLTFSALCALAINVIGCENTQPSTLTVALSSEAPIPTGVQSISIKVSRGGTTFLDSTYLTRDSQEQGDAAKSTEALTVEDIPGTLTVYDDEKETGPVTIQIEADVLTGSGTIKKAVRAATLSFVPEKQKLIRMPIQIACAQDITCSEGESCRAGRCLPNTTAESELEDYLEEKVIPVEGQCFQREDCADEENEIRIPIEAVVDVFEDDCTVPYVFPSTIVPSDAQFEGVTSAQDERLVSLRSQVNMGYIWSGDYNVANVGKDETNGEWTIVDKDDVEGWGYANEIEASKGNPNSDLRATLSEGLCTALKEDKKAIEKARKEAEKTGAYIRPQTRLLGTVELRGCQPKPRTLPECKPGQSGVDTN